jgi:streptomycin 6-kinase
MMRMKNNNFEKNIQKSWGQKGIAWLSSLPFILEELKAAWNLSDMREVENLSYNYVMTAYQNELPVVLKLSCDVHELQKEIETLKAYNGNGSIQLLQSSLQYQAMLLERAMPGTSLLYSFPHHDDEAMMITINSMNLLHAAQLLTMHQLPTLHDWFKELYNPHPALDTYHINKAQNMLAYLLSTSSRQVILHGDLHHGNILSSRRGYVAIDPKGIIGDHAFEPYAFIRNPDPVNIKPRELILYRIKFFSSHAGLDAQRIHAWAYLQAVLEACWQMQEGQTDPQAAMAEACQLDELEI